MGTKAMKDAGITKAEMLKEVKEAFSEILAGQDTHYNAALVVAHLNLAEGVTEGLIAGAEIPGTLRILSERISRERDKPFSDETDAEIERLTAQKERLEALDRIINYC